MLFAIGSERYTPYLKERKPQEILTIANHILGKNQLSLAKYLFICAKEDDPTVSTHHIPEFLKHILERIDLSSDLHFYTKTTIDTLDYSGTGINSGSKLVIAVAGEKRRELWAEMPVSMPMPRGYHYKVIMPGIIAVEGPAYTTAEDSE